MKKIVLLLCLLGLAQPLNAQINLFKILGMYVGICLVMDGFEELSRAGQNNRPIRAVHAHLCQCYSCQNDRYNNYVAQQQAAIRAYNNRRRCGCYYYCSCGYYN